MRFKIPVVHAAGITLLWFALSLLLFLSTSSGDSPSPRTEQSEPDGLNPGPDIIMGEIPVLQQFGSSGTQVGLAMGTDSCNGGDQELGFFAMPNTDHPVMAQNLYRMSGGTANDARFEQIGQSWITHGFFALQQNACGFGCTPASGGNHLGVGCSNPDSLSLNAGPLNMGSRAWVNPFTGLFPSTASSHTGHTHSGTSHRILVESSDLDTTMNPGATYYAEAQYLTPHEYAWCQAHPGQCNMYENASHRKFRVTGTTSFVFSPVGSTVRMAPAINAWPGATIRTIEPAPGIDGRAFLAYKVTGPVNGVYHYEYAIYNQNLDRGIQSLTVPIPTPSSLSGGFGGMNPQFHAPPQHPGFAGDGTVGDAGFSGAPWTMENFNNMIKWSTETFAQNPNANAIRWGTLYNFRFGSNRPPTTSFATVGFFKTGTPITVEIRVPRGSQGGPTPTPTSTPRPPTPTPTPTPTPSPSPTPACTPAPPLDQGFADITTLVPAGWFMQNNSQPGPGATGWFQGNTAVFAAQSGGANSYIGANFNNGTGVSTLSNWLLTPQLILDNGVELTFWTRTVTAPTFPDRLQVRMSTNGASTNVGTAATDVGDFTTLLLDINPTYTSNGYPNVWTQFTVTLSGLGSPEQGRLAFRYFVENGGPSGANSDYIGIDSLHIGGCIPLATPTPTSTPPATPVTTRFEVIAPPVVFMFNPFSFTVRALDQFNNTATNYNGTVHFTTTALSSFLPPNSPISGGFGTFTADLHSERYQRISVTDRLDPGITGTSNNIFVISDFISPSPTPPTPTPIPTPTPPTPTPVPTPTPTPGTPTPTPGCATLVSESFDHITTLVSGGWFMQNNSQPVGPSGWLQGDTTLFPAHSTSGYIAANFQNGAGAATLSNWLLTPPLTLQNGVELTFFTRTVTTRAFPDRLQVRMSTSGTSTDVGTTSTSVGDFTTLLLDINPNYTLNGYPNVWTYYSVTVSGLASPATGRLALRYFVQNAGPTGNNSDYIGIDSLQVTNTCGPTPTPTATPPCPLTIWSEDFDGVVPPAFPPGWVGGPGGCWSISNIDPDTPPNDAFCPDIDGISDCALDSPSITIPSAAAVLTFRNNFDTEFSDGVFWDGGVLEVSAPNIGGGEFLDITSPQIGGSIVVGGYTGEISGDASNPLAGRMAWSGNSNGYITTVANLGPNVSGQTIRLRWRFGSDKAVSAAGWRIDTITITEGACGGTPTPTPTATISPTPFPETFSFAINAPSKWDVNVPLSFSVTALDLIGNPDPTFHGLVHFTSSDATADLPPDTKIQNGFGTFSATFHTVGSHTITATSGSITGTSNPINVLGPTPTPTATPTSTPTPPPTPTTTPSPSPTSTPPTQPLNVSTRLHVQIGDNAGIGGFIITGTAPKRLLFRGIGPSLSASGVSNPLANPTLDLRAPNGVSIRANDNWRETQETEINATGLAPTNDLEAAMVDTLDPGSYTVILRGAGTSTGVGLVEIYDLDHGSNSKLANLSTRALVGIGNDVVIAGFILGGSGSDNVVVRGIGPSLSALGVPDALSDPTLELRDSNGALLISNNDWQDDLGQMELIAAAGLAPTNDLESGIAATLSPGLYTAILAGQNAATGVGLVEIYDRGPP